MRGRSSVRGISASLRSTLAAQDLTTGFVQEARSSFAKTTGNCAVPIENRDRGRNGPRTRRSRRANRSQCIALPLGAYRTMRPNEVTAAMRLVGGKRNSSGLKRA